MRPQAAAGRGVSAHAGSEVAMVLNPVSGVEEPTPQLSLGMAPAEAHRSALGGLGGRAGDALEEGTASGSEDLHLDDAAQPLQPVLPSGSQEEAFALQPMVRRIETPAADAPRAQVDR